MCWQKSREAPGATKTPRVDQQNITHAVRLSGGFFHGKEKVMEIDEHQTGEAFWRDTAAQHGLEKAEKICLDSLETRMKHELSQDEKRFCRELFMAMQSATADHINPSKAVYPLTSQDAYNRGEREVYFDSMKRNRECAQDIHACVNASCYKTNFYNLNLVAMVLIQRHGFERVNHVLAGQIRYADWDGRYSTANKTWARTFSLPDAAKGLSGVVFSLSVSFGQIAKKSADCARKNLSDSSRRTAQNRHAGATCGIQNDSFKKGRGTKRTLKQIRVAPRAGSSEDEFAVVDGVNQ
jgi:hypothetical protein